MGWVSYHATFYKKGAIDRKAECDNEMTATSENGTKWEVLKSAMRGSTYYAAVKRTNPDGSSYVFGVVCLTSVDRKDYDNFAYKDMDETMGSYKYDCPLSILDLLSPTDNEYALEWRKKCRENAQNKNGIGKLPIGTEIEFDWYGTKKRAVKNEPNLQFRTTWWGIPGTSQYIPKKYIPKDFRVVSVA